MQNKDNKNNFAYIDGNNLYRGIGNSGWKIDLIRFRRWLHQKYDVVRAYYFIGLVPTYLNDFRGKLGLKRKNPVKDESIKGFFS